MAVAFNGAKNNAPELQLHTHIINMAIDDFTVDDLPNRQHSREFEEEIRRDGPWPNPPTRGTTQLTNLAGVLYRLQTMDNITEDRYKDARNAEAKLAKKIKPSLEDEYWKTVHAHCVRDLGYEGDGAMGEFVEDARRFLKRW